MVEETIDDCKLQRLSNCMFCIVIWYAVCVGGNHYATMALPHLKDVISRTSYSSSWAWLAASPYCLHQPLKYRRGWICYYLMSQVTSNNRKFAYSLDKKKKWYEFLLVRYLRFNYTVNLSIRFQLFCYNYMVRMTKMFLAFYVQMSFKPLRCDQAWCGGPTFQFETSRD